MFTTCHDTLCRITPCLFVDKEGDNPSKYIQTLEQFSSLTSDKLAKMASIEDTPNTDYNNRVDEKAKN